MHVQGGRRLLVATSNDQLASEIGLQQMAAAVTSLQTSQTQLQSRLDALSAAVTSANAAAAVRLHQDHAPRI